jgi:hypothetical protein
MVQIKVSNLSLLKARIIILAFKKGRGGVRG